jgi:hypothetical protein
VTQHYKVTVNYRTPSGQAHSASVHVDVDDTLGDLDHQVAYLMAVDSVRKSKSVGQIDGGDVMPLDTAP